MQRDKQGRLVRGNPGVAMPNGGNNRAPHLDDAMAGHTTYRFGRPARGFPHVVVWYHNTPSVGSPGWHWNGGLSRRAREGGQPPAGWGSTPTNPRQPVPDCDLPAAARQRPTGVHLPPDPRLDLRRAARPPGVPPAFNETARESQAMASRVGGLAGTPQWVKSNDYETLCGKQLALQLWTGPNGIDPGRHGRSTTGPSTAPTQRSTSRSIRTSSSRLLLPCRKESTASEVRLRFNLLKGLSGMSPKNSFWTDVPTPGNPPLPNNPSTSPSPD